MEQNDEEKKLEQDMQISILPKRLEQHYLKDKNDSGDISRDEVCWFFDLYVLGILRKLVSILRNKEWSSSYNEWMKEIMKMNFQGNGHEEKDVKKKIKSK